MNHLKNKLDSYDWFCGPGSLKYMCVYLYIIHILSTHTYAGASQKNRMSWKSSFISVIQLKLVERTPTTHTDT